MSRIAKDDWTAITTGFALIVCAVLSNGCVNMSTLQTARALPVGQGRAIVGGGYYESEPITTEDGAESLTLPYAEVGYRRGVAPNLEVGAKVTIPGTIGVDGKYQLVDQDGFAVAVGLGVGYLKMSAEDENGDEVASLQLFDIQVPVYASYDVHENFSLYLAPKYVARVAVTEEDSAVGHLGGLSAGVRIGGAWGVFLEATYMRSLNGDSEFDATQFTSAVYF
jgi:hypothetical protein